MCFSLLSIKCLAAPPSLQLLPSAVIKLSSTVQTTKQCTAIVGSWEEPPSISLIVAKNTFVGWALNFRVCILLKFAAKEQKCYSLYKSVLSCLINNCTINFFLCLLYLAIWSSSSSCCFLILGGAGLALLGLAMLRLLTRKRNLMLQQDQCRRVEPSGLRNLVNSLSLSLHEHFTTSIN